MFGLEPPISDEPAKWRAHAGALRVCADRFPSFQGSVDAVERVADWLENPVGPDPRLARPDTPFPALDLDLEKYFGGVVLTV